MVATTDAVSNPGAKLIAFAIPVVGLTVSRLVAVELHVTDALGTVVPRASFTVAVARTESPSTSVAAGSDTVTDAGGPGVGGAVESPPPPPPPPPPAGPGGRARRGRGGPAGRPGRGWGA